MIRRLRQLALRRLLPLGLAAAPRMLMPFEPAEAEAPSEYAVEAAFLYNFTKFIEWPDAAFASPAQPFGICVVGPDPFGTALEDAAGRPVGSHRTELHRLAPSDPAEPCQIVFLSGMTGEETGNWLQTHRGKAILTVGDAPGFALSGGVIGFVPADGHVRFEINLQAAARAHLIITSRLLGLATIVRDADERRPRP